MNSLSTPTLRLEPVRDADLNLLRTWETMPGFRCVFPFIPWPANGRLEAFLRGSESFRAMLCFSAELQAFGWAAFAHLDWKNRSLSLAWGLHKSSEHLEFELVQALVKFAFDELNLMRLEAEILANAHTTARVLERLGFMPEVHKLEAAKVGRHFEDTLTYGLLRDLDPT